MKIIWTRSIDSWQADKKLFNLSLEEVIVLPCARQQAIDCKISSNINCKNLSQLADKKSVIIVTSLKCAQYLVANKLLREITTSNLVVSLSHKAYLYLKKFFTKVCNPDEIIYANEMLKWIESNISKEHTIVLPGPVTRAYALYDDLMSTYKVVNIDLYKTTYEFDISCEYQQRYLDYMQENKAGVIAFASPSAVKGFVNRFFDDEQGLEARLIAVCIGKTTYSYCRDYFHNLIITPHTSIEALIRTAEENII